MNIMALRSRMVRVEDIDSCVKLAAESLRHDGNIIAVPTETVYGVASNLSKKSIEKLYEVKRRDFSKPIALCLDNVNDISKFGKLTVPETQLSKLLPGPVTVVLERTENVPKELNPTTNLIGIRIPDFPFLQKIVHSFGPIALTSANISNTQSSLDVEEFKDLWNDLAVIFDGGKLLSDSRTGSTVVNLSVPGKFNVIRSGQALDTTRKVLLEHGLVEQ